MRNSIITLFAFTAFACAGTIETGKPIEGFPILAAPKVPVCTVVGGEPFIAKIDTFQVNQQLLIIRTLQAKDRAVCEVAPDTATAKK